MARESHSNPPPQPRPGFESDFINELDRLFSELPAETATMKIGRLPGRPDWTEPFFELLPKNPRQHRFPVTPLRRM
jgi:hypothetical protein